MNFIGIDLAWGDQKPTGLAVLDEHGRLRHLDVARSDAGVLAQLRQWVRGACVVAFDAPLVVINPTGTRACEAALNADYRRFDAGAYPANTSLPWFADGGRGARLCTALQLDVDPYGNCLRKGIEVYPHAASVALFNLSKTIKYKQKTGRDLEHIRAELARLMGLIETLKHSDPPLLVNDNSRWRDLTQSLQTATQKAQLRRIEDPVDAVLCAYIALFATRRPEATTVYGDAATGCIVTPSLDPLHLKPAGLN